MKTMKVALLATAALAAFSVSARADEAAAIKAQLEALTARIAQLEAAPAVPVGFSLLTISEVAPLTLTGESGSDRNMIKSSNRISILPTADAPASTTVDWDVEIRTALYYEDLDVTGSNDDDMGIDVRGRLRIKAQTETSVGAVGVDMRVQGNFDLNGRADFTHFDPYGTNEEAVVNIAWGWWAMTPEWQLGAGYTGSLSLVGYGTDSLTYGEIYGPRSIDGDQTQMRLTYASGPLSWAVAIEDNNFDRNSVGVTTQLGWTGDSVNGVLAAGFYPTSLYVDDKWIVGAGVGFNLGDMATLSLAAQTGSDELANDDYWNASALAVISLSDAASLEVGYAYESLEGPSNNNSSITIGAYWVPVDQLRIGVIGTQELSQGPIDPTSVSLVTWMSF